jgi:DNA-binding NarL/FixJ family response regulator
MLYDEPQVGGEAGDARRWNLAVPPRGWLAAPVKVLLAETRVIVAEAMEQALQGAEGLTLTARCSDRPGVVLACAAGAPDVAVLDIGLYCGGPDYALQSLREVAPGAKALLSIPELDADLYTSALRAGADNCISGRVDRHQFIDAVRATAAGESVVPLPLADGSRTALSQPLVGRLSRREIEVLQLAALGHSVAEIAAELCVSRNTAQTHLRRTYRKLGVHNRSGAISEAQRLGILRIRPPARRVTRFSDSTFTETCDRQEH